MQQVVPPAQQLQLRLRQGHAPPAPAMLRLARPATVGPARRVCMASTSRRAADQRPAPPGTLLQDQPEELLLVGLSSHAVICNTLHADSWLGVCQQRLRAPCCVRATITAVLTFRFLWRRCDQTAVNMTALWSAAHCRSVIVRTSQQPAARMARSFNGSSRRGPTRCSWRSMVSASR